MSAAWSFHFILPENVMGFVLPHVLSLLYMQNSLAGSPTLLSHRKTTATGSEVVFSDSDEVAKLMSSCPHLGVSMGGVSVPCLVDTGSMVSTVTESFFH